jgi:CheY-like chemotaxis protein
VDSSFNTDMGPAKLRCVVVDDDREFLAQVSRWLLTNGTDVDVASFTSSVDALDHLRREPVDLILTAYLVAPLDGLQLISIIRGFNPHVPIGLMSGVPLEATALARGATAFLPKPRPWSQLETLLAELRRGRAPLAA